MKMQTIILTIAVAELQQTIIYFLSFTFDKRSTLRFVFSNTLGTHDVW